MNIKNKVMKVFKFFIAGLLMFTGVFQNLSPVIAETLEGEFEYGSDTGYYIVSKAGSHGSASNGLNYKRIKRKGSSTWIPAFCMQPGVTLHNGDTIKPSEYTQKRLARLAFLGYYNQKNAKNYINTQALVYDELGDDVSYVSTGNYASFKKTVLEKYAQYSTKPKWNKEILVNAGSTATFSDSHKVFEDYQTFTITKNGITLSHTKGQNTLKVAVAKTCKVKSQKFSESELKKVGGYKWKSTSDVNVYYKNSDGQDIITFGHVDAVGFSLDVDVQYSSLKISKEDENGILVPHTSFQLSYQDDMSAPIGVYTTGEDGTVTIDQLLPENIYIQETQVPDHLILDKTIHKVTLTSNKTASFKAVNKIKKGQIIVTKKDAQNDKTVLQSGVEFEIYDKKTNTVVDKIVTNDKGIAISKELVYGEYYVKEVKAPQGYQINVTTTDVNIVVDAYQYQVTIKNSKTLGKILIEKTGEVLSGYEDGKFIYSQKGLKGMEAQVIAEENILDPADQSILYKKGAVVCTVVTGEDGKATVEVPLGKYRVKEIKAPQGYVLSKEEKIVSLSYSHSSVSIESGSISFLNDRQKVKVQAIKKNSLTKKAVENAVIGLYAKQDILNHAGKKIVDHDTLLKTAVSNKEGNIVFDLDLPLSKYYLKEIEAPQGFVKSEEIYDIDAISKDQTTKIYTFEKEIENKPITVKVTKQDLTSSKEITGAKLEVIDKESQKVVDSWISDAQKAHYIYNLVKGKKYILRETLAPQGFVKAHEIEFEVAGTSQVQNIIMKDEQALGEIQVFKKGEVLTDFQDGKFIYEEKGLANATFEIYAQKDIKNIVDGSIIFKAGDKVAIIITDDKGYASSGKLPLGVYEVKETKAPEGYVLNNAIETVELKYKDQNTVLIKEQAHFVNQRQNVDLTVIKKDDQTNQLLAGASFQLFNKNDIKNHKGEVIVKANTLLDTQISNNDGKVHFRQDLPLGIYVVKEEKTPNGYAFNHTMIEMNAGYQGQNKSIVKLEQNFFNESTKILISKVDITNSKEISGARLSIIDTTNDQIIDSWVSDEKQPHYIEKLVVGRDYILTETKPADGYATAESIKFTVKDTGDVQSVIMKDDITKIDISKTDITGHKELVGAKLEVRDENDKVIDSWTSTKTPHRIEKLVVKKTYTLIERKPADGYATAESIKFTVKDTGDVQAVVMKDDITKIDISKTDITGHNELVGARLEVRDENDKVIDSWTSTKTPHRIEKLVVKKTYTLIERKPADGYVTAESIKFTVKDTSDIQKVIMKDDMTKIEIQKLNTSGNHLIGAQLRIVDKESGKTVYEFISDENSRRIDAKLVVGKTYILKEDEAPEGYVRARDVEFKVLDTSNVQVIQMIDKAMFIHKVDVDKNAVKGVTLQVVSMKTKNIVDQWVTDGLEHRVSNLSVDESYILREAKAPMGYVRAEDMTFTVDDDYQNQFLTMVNKKVTVHKTDITDGKELPGAMISVIHKESKKEVDKWISTNKEHEINNLVENETYILIEVQAPDGYSIAESIEFKVDGINEDGVKFNQHYEMKDELILTNIQVNKIDSQTKEVIKGQDFEFTLYADKECQDEIVSLRSDQKNGTVTFEKLRYGTYFIKETKAPQGYYLSDEVKEIIISDELKNVGATYEVDYENQPVDVIQTGDYQRIGIYVMGMMIPLSYFFIMSYLKKKKDTSQ